VTGQLEQTERRGRLPKLVGDLRLAGVEIAQVDQRDAMFGASPMPPIRASRFNSS
jgi:hypothetical protein